MASPTSSNPESPGPPAVRLVGLSKRFAGGEDAVSKVDLDVSEGEFVTVVGPSGSGKSTLLRMIAGLESPDSGAVMLGGIDVARLPPGERGVGLTFQTPALYPYLSVRDNLAFGLRGGTLGRAEIGDRVRSVADWLGLAGLLDRKPEALSGGERQRVALGRAVARRPKVLLLDEPLSSLDGPLRASVREALLALRWAGGLTVVHVTHDQGEALSLGDRIAVMERGRLVQVGTPRSVHDAPETRFVAGFLGDPPMNFLNASVSRHGDLLRILVDGLSGPLEWPGGGALRPELDGRRVEVGIRPESVRVGGQGPSVGRFAVTSAEYRGHESVVTFAVGPARLAARVAGGETFRPGDSLELAVDWPRAAWFDRETGCRVV